jgi:pimeloyl-ACP methyl ester carboxylesterase
VHGSGEPLLLVHGYPLSGRLWAPILPALRGEFRSIVPDLRGFGQSEASATADLARYVDDLVALLDHVGETRPVVLVGMSMGGYIAFEFYRRHPDRLRAMVLANTRARADSEAERAARQETARRALREGAGSVAQEMASLLFGVHAAQALREEWIERMSASDPRGIAAALEAMAQRPDSLETLAAAELPILIIAGADDTLTPLEEARRMQQAAPNARLVTLDQAGHMSPVEQPRPFVAALREFVRGSSEHDKPEH